MWLFYILACSGTDRLRGSGKWPLGVGRLLYAAVASLPVVRPEDGYWMLVFALLFFVGSTYGWGNPMGRVFIPRKHAHAAPERWQAGPLVTYPLLALFVRGLMWLAPAAFIYIPTGNALYLVAPIAMTVAFTASPYIARALVKDEARRWAPMEYLRGGIYGLMTSTAGLYL
jgi:hypothetical protein